VITSNLQEVADEIKAIADRAADMRPYMELIGRMEVDAVRMRIASLKMSPEGVPWAPWSAMRARERAAKGNEQLGLLLDEGALFRSIRFNASPVLTEIGSDLSYAAKLQDGAYREPARPFLGWPVGNGPEMESLAILFLEKGIAIEPTY